MASAVKVGVMAAAVDAVVSAAKLLQAKFVLHAKAVAEVKDAPTTGATTAQKGAVNCVKAKLALHAVSALSVANAQSVLQANVRRVKVVVMVALKAKKRGEAMPCQS